MSEPTPFDPYLIRARLAEGRTASAFKVFADVTNGPGLRARVIEYSTLALGAAFGAAGARTVVDALTTFLPGWACVLISIPFLILGFLGGLTALTAYLAAVAFGFRVGKQWIVPLLILLVAGALPSLSDTIGPWWPLAGYWVLLLAAMYVGILWAAPAIGRDIELHHAVQDWSQTDDDS